MTRATRSRRIRQLLAVTGCCAAGAALPAAAQASTTAAAPSLLTVSISLYPPGPTTIATITTSISLYPPGPTTQG